MDENNKLVDRTIFFVVSSLIKSLLENQFLFLVLQVKKTYQRVLLHIPWEIIINMKISPINIKAKNVSRGIWQFFLCYVFLLLPFRTANQFITTIGDIHVEVQLPNHLNTKDDLIVFLKAQNQSSIPKTLLVIAQLVGVNPIEPVPTVSLTETVNNVCDKLIEKPVHTYRHQIRLDSNKGLFFKRKTQSST